MFLSESLQSAGGISQWGIDTHPLRLICYQPPIEDGGIPHCDLYVIASTAGAKQSRIPKMCLSIQTLHIGLYNTKGTYEDSQMPE